MSLSFAQMMANKKAKAAGQPEPFTDSAGTQPATPVEQPSQSPLAAPQPPTDSVANTPAKPKLNFGGAKPQAASEAKPETPSQPKVNLFGLKKPDLAPAKPTVEQQLGDKQTFSLDDLENLELPEEPKTVRSMSNFTDETPADKPTRVLPEGVNADEVAGFVGLMDSVYEIIHEPDLLGQVIKNIMIELHQNPQYLKMVVKEDARTWVQAMRNHMGLVRIKKQEAKAKRGTSAAAKKAKVSDSELDDIFNGMGVDLG